MTDYNQKVADIAAQKMKDQSAIEQQNIAAKAAGAGGLDSSRFAILEAERQKNLTGGIGDLYSKANAAALDSTQSITTRSRVDSDSLSEYWLH